MADWPENDYRLFCGNLGNEVSDEVLANAFRKYKSFFRARVIRDKRTMKTKGYLYYIYTYILIYKYLLVMVLYRS